MAQLRRLLTEGEAKLEEIATQLGFSSAFHLSLAFKQEFGQAPDHWRRQLGGGIPKARSVRRASGA